MEQPGTAREKITNYGFRNREMSSVNPPRVISAESEHDVAIVGHGDRIFLRRQVILTVQQTATIQIERMLQVDLLDGRVG